MARYAATGASGRFLCRGAARKQSDGLAKGQLVEMAHERDDIAAARASAAIPDLLFQVDGEAVEPAAYRARAATLGDPGGEFDPPAGNFAFEANGTGHGDHSVIHARPRR